MRSTTATSGTRWSRSPSSFSGRTTSTTTCQRLEAPARGVGGARLQSGAVEAEPPCGSHALALRRRVGRAARGFRATSILRREAARFRLEPVPATGLPETGMWRASFRVADVNGDRIPDIVSPPARLGDGELLIWTGDGTGRFTRWKISLFEGGKPLTRFSIDYGGVAVGDIDGDGNADVVSASHSGGLVSLFGDGKGGFEVVRKGLPARDFSAQAVALAGRRRRREARHGGLPRRRGPGSQPGRRQDAGPRLRVPGARQRLAAPQGRDRRRLLLEQPGQLGLRQGRPGGRPDRQPLQRRAHPPLEEPGDGSFLGRRSPPSRSTPTISQRPRAPSGGPGARVRRLRPHVSQRAASRPRRRHHGLRVPGREWEPAPRLAQEGPEVKTLSTASRWATWTGTASTTSFSPTARSDASEDLLPAAGRHLRRDRAKRTSRFSTRRVSASASRTSTRDGRLDVVLSKTVSSARPNDKGGWDVYLNRR